MFNKVEIIGNLTTAPISRSKSAIAFCIAVDDSYTDSNLLEIKRTYFIDCVCYDELGKIVFLNFKKGDQIHVKGHLITNMIDIPNSTHNIKSTTIKVTKIMTLI